MPHAATSASERPAAMSSKSLNAQRRDIQQAMKEGRSGELAPATIAAFLHDSVAAIRDVLETPGGDLERTTQAGLTERTPANQVQALAIANRCVTMVGAIAGNSRLRAGLTERTEDGMRVPVPAFRALVEHLTGSTGHPEIVRNSHMLALDLLGHLAGTEVTRNCPLPPKLWDNIAEHLNSSVGSPQQDVWSRAQGRLDDLVRSEPAWAIAAAMRSKAVAREAEQAKLDEALREARMRALNAETAGEDPKTVDQAFAELQKLKSLSDRMDRRMSAHDTKAMPVILATQPTAPRPLYASGPGSLATEQLVEQKMAEALSSRRGLADVGPIATVVAGHPQKAGFDKHSKQAVWSFIEAIRTERESEFWPVLAESFLQFAKIVRGQGFAAAGVTAHDARKLAFNLDDLRTTRLLSHLSDNTELSEGLRGGSRARQVASVQRKLQVLLADNNPSGGEQAVTLLETIESPQVLRAILRGNMLSRVMQGSFASAETDPDRSYPAVRRLLKLAGNDVAQLRLSPAHLLGFSTYAQAHHWEDSLQCLERFFGTSTRRALTISTGRRHGTALAAKLGNALQQQANDKAVACIRPNPGPVKPGSSFSQLRYQLFAMLENPSLRVPYLDVINVCEAIPSQASRDKLLTRELLSRIVPKLFQDGRDNPDRAYPAMRRLMQLAPKELPFVGLSQGKIDRFTEYAQQQGWAEVAAATVGWVRRMPDIPGTAPAGNKTAPRDVPKPDNREKRNQPSRMMANAAGDMPPQAGKWFEANRQRFENHLAGVRVHVKAKSAIQPAG